LFPRQHRVTASAAAVLAVLLTASCSDSNNPPAPRPPGPGPAPLAPELIMDETTPAPGIPMSFPDGVAVFQEDDGEWLYFNENNRQRRILVSSIGSASLVHEIVIESAANGGRDSNGQICEDAEGNRIWGEDSGQSSDDPAVFAYAGWGVFDGDYNQVGKLTPTHVSTTDQSEPFGCGLARDGSGRLFTTEVGSQSVGATSGQLIIWFPDPDRGFRVWPGNVPASEYPNANFSDNYCKLADDLSTASSIWVDADNNVYVGNAGNGTVVVFKPPFPTGPDAAGGCSGTDGFTGAPMVDPGQGDPLDREVFIEQGKIFSPSGIVQSPVTGNWYVSGVFDGKILEFSPDGKTLYQTILDPADNDPPENPLAPGGLPLSSGNPYGLALDAEGTLYFTDMHLTGSLPKVGPASGKGKLWRIRFRDE
jgi:sugar lactone lactonase YvrE